MPLKTKRIVDLLGNRDGGDTSNRQAQDRRATVADPVVHRQDRLKMIVPFTMRLKVPLPIPGTLT